jgi:hypothetical protein
MNPLVVQKFQERFREMYNTKDQIELYETLEVVVRMMVQDFPEGAEIRKLQLEIILECIDDLRGNL